MAEDYDPFEISQPPLDKVKGKVLLMTLFSIEYYLENRVLVEEKTFANLRKLEDDIRNQVGDFGSPHKSSRKSPDKAGIANEDIE